MSARARKDMKGKVIVRLLLVLLLISWFLAGSVHIVYAAPFYLGSTANTETTVTLQWTAPGDLMFISYKVWYATNAAGPWNLWDEIFDQSVTSSAVLWLANNTDYYFKVHHSAHPFIEGDTNIIEVRTAANPQLSITSYDYSSVSLAWNDYNTIPYSALVPFVSYILQVSTSGLGGNWSTCASMSDPSQNSFRQLGLSPTTGYWFQLYDVVSYLGYGYQSYSNIVYVPPRALSASISPSSVVIYVGQSQLFSSTVTGGTSPYTYKWYLDGSPYPGATNPTWTFTPNSTGSYTVSLVANDSATPPASAQSNNASVTAISATVYIMGDGSVVPSFAPISSIDNVTYTFTGNVSYPTYDGVAVERNNIVIDGSGYTVQGNQSGDTGLSLTGISNVTIKNMAIKNFDYGIDLYSSSDNNTLSGNNVTNNHVGIRLYSSSGNALSGNNVTANNPVGIWLYSSSDNNTLYGNNVANNFDGISLDSSSDNILSSNNVTANNGYAGGIVIFDSSDNNALSGNTVTANSNFGIWLDATSDNNVLSGNNVTANNGYGIAVLYSSDNNALSGNTITANSNFGIWLISTSDNILSSNNVANNGNGIYLYSSLNNSVSGNNVTNNDEGIALYSSSNNKFYHNSFVDNTQQVYSNNSTNTWDDGYPSGGNYWSDYNGTDLYGGPYQNLTGSDGIGDTPYIIDANNTDHYPLMNPYNTNSLSVTISPASSTLVKGQSQLFTSEVLGGTLPYTYQWYLNDAPVTNATLSNWAFKLTSAGSYRIYVKVTDSAGMQATSNTALVQTIFLKGPCYNDYGIEYWVVSLPGGNPTRIISNLDT